MQIRFDIQTVNLNFIIANVRNHQFFAQDRRFTTASMKKLFDPVFKGGLEIESFGNILAATTFLQGVTVEDLPNRALLAEDPDYTWFILIIARKGP